MIPGQALSLIQKRKPKRMKSSTPAHERGQVAALDRLQNNPYRKTDDEWMEWENGFRQAMDGRPPGRVKMHRVRHWVMPENSRCVDRSSQWGNPFRVEGDVTAVQAVAMFADWLDAMDPERRASYLEPIRGKHLGCHCDRGAPCHADILLQEANRPRA